MKPIFKYLLLFFFIAVNLLVLYSTVSEKESEVNKTEQSLSSNSGNKSASQKSKTKNLSEKSPKKKNTGKKTKEKKKRKQNNITPVEEKEQGIFNYLTSKITGNDTKKNQKAANAKDSILKAKQSKAVEISQDYENYILCGDGIQPCPPPKPAGQCKCNAQQSFLSMFNGSM
jgi:hypothetical protein